MEQPVRRRPRRKRKTQTPNSKQLLIAGCVIGAVALIIAACIFLFGGNGSGSDQTPQRGPLKELTVEALTRDGKSMVVRTSYMNVEFPYAFSDLIQVEAINESNRTALTFSARINGADRKLYTIWFNASVGQPVGKYDLQNDQPPVAVSVEFFQPDGKLSEDDRKTFFATQETVNEVLSSMEKDTCFSN